MSSNLDLDMPDISATQVLQQDVKNTSEISQDQDFANVCKRLGRLANINEACVCIPVYTENKTVSGFYTKTITECTPTEFKSWVDFVFPAADQFGHSVMHYDTPEKRETAMAGVIALLQDLRKRFASVN
jgi:hypothetical protein